MNRELAASYAHCQQLARRAASNFYLSFLLLARPKRQSMCALYAFLRRADDLCDSGAAFEDRRSGIREWRRSMHRCLKGQMDDPLLPALADTVHRYRIPHQYLDDVLDGVEMDLEPRSYESFDELREYCYRVASVVGLACIHVWGFQGDEAFKPARSCGLAFQLTNILRDLKEDAMRDRCYLPQAELRQFGYGQADLKQGVRNQSFTSLMKFQIDRAERWYDEARDLETYLSPDGRRAFRAMYATYRGLIDEIKHRNGDVFSRRVRLTNRKKFRIALSQLWMRSPTRVSNS